MKKEESMENKENVIKELIKQNSSGNDCLAYSFKSERNKEQLSQQQNKLYYHKARNYIKNYEFEKAVESYCKISQKYEDFDDIVEQLKRWLSNDSDLYPKERQKVEEKLQELNNQCPVSPLNDITN